VAGTEPPAFLESLFASGLLGAALAPVNHRLAAGEIRAVLADTEPRVLIQHGATDLVPAPASVRRRISVAGPGTGGRRGGGRVRRASPGSAVTEQEILVFARQRLGAHQAPASVTFVDRLPRNPVGKLVRARLGTLGGRP
jgi:acyl-CoA synthetase (AMP-forming)/AMP-acid ligase II